MEAALAQPRRGRAESAGLRPIRLAKGPAELPAFQVGRLRPGEGGCQPSPAKLRTGGLPPCSAPGLHPLGQGSVCGGMGGCWGEGGGGGLPSGLGCVRLEQPAESRNPDLEEMLPYFLPASIDLDLQRRAP